MVALRCKTHESDRPENTTLERDDDHDNSVDDDRLISPISATAYADVHLRAFPRAERN